MQQFHLIKINCPVCDSTIQLNGVTHCEGCGWQLTAYASTFDQEQLLDNKSAEFQMQKNMMDEHHSVQDRITRLIKQEKKWKQEITEARERIRKASEVLGKEKSTPPPGKKTEELELQSIELLEKEARLLEGVFTTYDRNHTKSRTVLTCNYNSEKEVVEIRVEEIHGSIVSYKDMNLVLAVAFAKCPIKDISSVDIVVATETKRLPYPLRLDSLYTLSLKSKLPPGYQYNYHKVIHLNHFSTTQFDIL